MELTLQRVQLRPESLEDDRESPSDTFFFQFFACLVFFLSHLDIMCGSAAFEKPSLAI